MAVIEKNPYPTNLPKSPIKKSAKKSIILTMIHMVHLSLTKMIHTMKNLLEVMILYRMKNLLLLKMMTMKLL